MNQRELSVRKIAFQVWSVIIISFAIGLPSAAQSPLARDDSSSHARNDETMPGKYSQAESMIKTYDSSRKSEDLEAAITQMRHAAFISDRSHTIAPDIELAKLWFQLFKTIDNELLCLSKQIGTVYTKVNVPSDGSSEIELLMPGTAPSKVQNPDLRKKYKKAIAANESQRQINIQYSRIRSLEEQASAYFFTWAGPRYRRNASERGKLLEIARSADLVPQRMETIEEAVGLRDLSTK